MSAAFARLRAAGRASFAVHATKTALALALALPASARLGDALHGADHDHPSWLLAVLHALHSNLAPLQTALFTTALLTLASVPLLAPFWLRAMMHPCEPLIASLARSVTLYPRALALLGLGLLYAACLAALALVLAWSTHHALAFSHDLRLRDLAAVSVTLPFALLALHALTVHDAAQAALVTEPGSPRSALRRALRCVRLRELALRALAGLTNPLFTFAALAGTRLCGEAAPLGNDTLVLITGQLAALLVTLTRGLWLSWLLGRITTSARRSTTA